MFSLRSVTINVGNDFEWIQTPSYTKSAPPHRGLDVGHFPVTSLDRNLGRAPHIHARSDSDSDADTPSMQSHRVGIRLGLFSGSAEMKSQDEERGHGAIWFSMFGRDGMKRDPQIKIAG